MPEILNLAVPEVVPAITTTEYRVIFLSLNWEQERIVIHVRGTNGERREFAYEKAVAVNLMIALNKADLSVKSLQRRILEKLNADGLLVGAVSGVPD